MPGLRRSSTKYRLGVPARFMMNVLNVDPVFTTRGGRLRISRFMSGYVRSTQDQFIRACLTSKRNINTEKLYVTFCGCSADQRAHILSEIERYSTFDEIIVNKASASTFCNCGPGAFGLIYELAD